MDDSEVRKIIAERDLYKKILDLLPAVVHINNLNNECVDWINDGVERLSGYKTEEIVGSKEFLVNSIIPDDLEWMYDSIETYRARPESSSFIYRMKKADGSEATYQGFGVVFESDENGNPIRTLAVDVDITHEISNYKQLRSHMEEMSRKLHESQVKQLTASEIRVVQLLCLGKTIREIATELSRSMHTIDNHKRHIFEKLGFNKMSQLIKWAQDVSI